MKTVLFMVFVALVTFLIVQFIRDWNKNRTSRPEESGVQPWMVTAIIAALVAQGLLAHEASEELEGLSFAELEDFLLQEEIFSTQDDFAEWLDFQPIQGDSLFDHDLDM